MDVEGHTMLEAVVRGLGLLPRHPGLLVPTQALFGLLGHRHVCIRTTQPQHFGSDRLAARPGSTDSVWRDGITLIH